LGIDLDPLERAGQPPADCGPWWDSDRIVDLVSSGKTLRQHHLLGVEPLLPVSARLCLGRLDKLHGDRIDELIGRLRETVATRAS
jgi:ATP phosphoribosyltransferase